MKSAYDQVSDVLTVDISDGQAIAPPEHPDPLTTLHFGPGRRLVRVSLAQARKRGLVPLRTQGKAPITQGWAAIRSFVAEYSLLTRLATLLLIAVALLNIAKEFPCPDSVRCLPENWTNALASDGLMTLLTLAVAFGVGLHIKVRLERGLIDGAEHYSIGRALAYGYFSNYLLIALMQLRTESRARGLAKGQLLKLKVVFPATPGDLEDFKQQVSQSRHQIRSVPVATPKGSSKVLQRQMLVIVDPAATAGPPTLFIDFPTTLYTMQDYFQTWDIWLQDRQRAPLGAVETERLYHAQIEQFFDHLDDLSHHSFGLAAARRVGFDEIIEADLASLFEDHFERVDGQALVRELQARD